MSVMFGAVDTAVANVGPQLAVMVRAHDFATSSDQSTAAARDVLNSGLLDAARGVVTVGSLSLAAGFVLVAIAAMRGAADGLRAPGHDHRRAAGAWPGAAWSPSTTGVLLLGRWPPGIPPARITGVARAGRSGSGGEALASAGR